MSKFAPITSSLLVRKGAAEPSLLAQQDKHALFWSQAPRPESRPEPRPEPHRERRADIAPPPAAAMQPRDAFPPPKVQPIVAGEFKVEDRKPVDHSERHKKITVSLSDHEHEALGIAAVKLGVTRNHLVRDALDALLESLERQYGGKCKCIADGSLQETCCQSGAKPTSSN